MKKSLISCRDLMILVLLPWLFAGCSAGVSQQKITLNYADAHNWVALPDGGNAHAVDVFYVYPTVFLGTEPGWMDVNDAALRKKAEGMLQVQGSVYADTADMYAPFYRQVSIAVLSLPDSSFENYFRPAYADVKAAFLYYLDHYNHGRPFILAGHSQGSQMIKTLMEDLFDDPDLQKQLVAAYIVGYSVTREDLDAHPWMKIAQSADDPGTIITYNTQAAGAEGSPVLLPGAQCINPLSWTTTDDYAPATLNLGAVFFDQDHHLQKEISNFTGAYIDAQGALVADTPDPDDYYNAAHPVFPRGIYHAYDYTFFYRNLQENAGRRVQAYLQQHNEQP